jgi:hypothetical protein
MPKPPRIARVLVFARWGGVVLEAAALAALTALIWSGIAGRPPLELFGGALLYVLLARAFALGMILLGFLAVSVDDFSDVVRAGLWASAPAMWFPPALLLMATATGWAMAAGLVLIAASVRLLVSRRAPDRKALVRRSGTRQPAMPMFGTVAGSPGSFRSVLGAVAGQAGIVAMIAGYPLWSAAFAGVGTALWTRSSIARGAFQPQTATRRPYGLAALALVLLFVAGRSTEVMFTEPMVFPGAEPTAGFFDSSRRLLQRLAHPPKRKSERSPQSATRLVQPPQAIGPVNHNGLPGVILRREKPRAQSLIVRAAPPIVLSPGKPLTIPFTGEYHLFRSSSGRLPAGSLVQFGTPFDSVFGTTNGGPMETDAFQLFTPSVDFSQCASIRLELLNGENFPSSATLQLVSPRDVITMGPEIFGLTASREEAVEFRLPMLSGALTVNGLRVIFQHNPTLESQNARVAIQRFTFLPRGI